MVSIPETADREFFASVAAGPRTGLRGIAEILVDVMATYEFARPTATVTDEGRGEREAA